MTLVTLEPRADDRPDLGDDYRDRFLLPDWREKRQAAIDRQHGKCAGCHRDDVPLQGHHLSYRHFRDERWHELIAVCKDCHPYADQFRKARKKLGAANVREVAAWGRAEGCDSYWEATRYHWMLAKLPVYVALMQERER
jgi:hypothetical protein